MRGMEKIFYTRGALRAPERNLVFFGQTSWNEDDDHVT